LEIVQIGKPAYVKIVKTFGKEILDSEGNIDRKKLGSV
jgi:dephospho-CoA kinase